jgi:hypothetical protein
VGPILRYNLARLGLLVGFLALFYLLGLGGAVLVLGAVLASGVVSYFVLARQREAMVVALKERVQARQAKAAAREAREDEYDDLLRGADPDA